MWSEPVAGFPSPTVVGQCQGPAGLGAVGDSCSVVVLAPADGTTHGAEDPKDRANDQQEDADGLQNGDARDDSHDHDSEDDPLRLRSTVEYLPLRTGVVT